MPYSAAESHHMVSEPSALDPEMEQVGLNMALFMFTSQNDPVEGDFDPNLPPVFDIYMEDVLYNMERPCFINQSETLKIIKDPEECHAQWLTIEVGNVFQTHGGTNPCYVEIDYPKSLWVFKEIGCDGIIVQVCGDDSLELNGELHAIGQEKIVFRTHYGMFKHNNGYIKLVFDPGIDQRMMAIYEQPSRH